jgi:hypothetical protein
MKETNLVPGAKLPPYGFPPPELTQSHPGP